MGRCKGLGAVEPAAVGHLRGLHGGEEGRVDEGLHGGEEGRDDEIRPWVAWRAAWRVAWRVAWRGLHGGEEGRVDEIR